MGLHESFDDLVDLYLAGGLSDDERHDADQHLNSCAGCATILADAGAFGGWVRGHLVVDAPPEDLEERVIARLRREAWSAPAAGPRMSLRWVRYVAGLAAVFCLVILGGLFTGELDGRRLVPAEGVAAAPRSQAAPDRNASWRYAGKAVEGKDQDAILGSRVMPADKPAAAPETPDQSRPYMNDLEPAKDAKTNTADDPGMAESGGSPAERYLNDRKLIRNADLTLEVEAYEKAYESVTKIAAEEKGFIAGADTQKLANGKIRATVTVRVPPERFEAVLARFRDLGAVRHQSITTQDVTKQYVDLEMRLKSKQALEERLRKILAEQKGTLKELMEVEVQLGKTIEEIESLKGEIKYYDNLVGLSTILLHLLEKDLGQPFEYVQTMHAQVGLTSAKIEEAYASAQKVIADAGGQIADVRMTRGHDSAEGFVRGRVDAEKFPAVREALKRLGHVDADTVNVQQTGRGGQEGPPKTGAPVRKEQAVVDVTLRTPAIHIARTAGISIEALSAEEAYQKARAAVEAAGGRVLDGSLMGGLDSASAHLKARVDAEKFSGLVEALKAVGRKVKDASVRQHLPPAAEGGVIPLVDEEGEISLSISTPAAVLGDEQGLVATLKRTLSGSLGGLLWSVEKLFVGISLAGPWVLLILAGWLIYRRVRTKRAQA